MSAVESHIEQRRYPRVSAAIRYSLVLDGENHTGVTGNISLGGVYLKTISPALQSSDITKSAKITLHLNPTPLSMECRIVYIGGGAIPHPEGVGVAFHDLGEETTATLEECILSKL